TEAQIAALYQKKIRELGARVRIDRRLANPAFTVTKRSRICGSAVTLDFDFRDGRIERIGYHTRACSLGMAATAIVVRVAPGQSTVQLEQAKDALIALLAGKETTIPADWQALEVFIAA